MSSNPQDTKFDVPVTPENREPIWTTIRMQYDLPQGPRTGTYGEFYSWGCIETIQGVDIQRYWAMSDTVVKMLLREGACKDSLMDVAKVKVGKKVHWKIQHNSGAMINKQTAEERIAQKFSGGNNSQAQTQAAPQQAQPAQRQAPAQQAPPAQRQAVNYNYPQMREDNFEAMRLARADYFKMYEDAVVEAYESLEDAQERLVESGRIPKTAFKSKVDRAGDLFAMAKEMATGAMISTVRSAEMKHGGLWQISVPEVEPGEAPDTEASLDDLDEEDGETGEPELDDLVDHFMHVVKDTKYDGDAKRVMTAVVKEFTTKLPEWFSHKNHVQNVIKNKLGYTATPGGEEAWHDFITEVLVYEQARQNGEDEVDACIAVTNATGRPSSLMPPISEADGEEEEAEEEPLY